MHSYWFRTLLFLHCAVLLRWPTIPFIDSAPLEPNFPLHAIAAKAISEGDWLSLPYLEWPSGSPVRYIAWPVLLIAVPLNVFFSAIASMNISVFLWIWLQGMGGYWIGKKHTNTPSALFLGLGCMFAPIQMIAMGNGQFEHMALFPLLWFFSSLVRKTSSFVPFALCLFSSPYQAIAALLSFPLFLSKEYISVYLKKAALEIVPLLCIGYFYFHAVSIGAVHESVMPAPSTMSEKTLPRALFFPINIAQNGGIPLSGPLERIFLLGTIPVASEYNHIWPWKVPTAGSYIGWTLWIGLFLGIRKGLTNKRIFFWAVICLICSLGSTFGTTNIPLPWALSKFIPGLDQIQATSRFLSGVTAALLLYTAIKHQKSIYWFSISLVLEGLLISPSYWPIPAKAPLLADNIKHINQPVAFWPAAPVISSHKVTMTALLLEQPLALFSEQNVSHPNAHGLVQYNLIRQDGNNRSPSQWKEDICSAGVQELIQFKDIVGNNGQPFFYDVHKSNTQCAESFCIWSLCHNTETQ